MSKKSNGAPEKAADAANAGANIERMLGGVLQLMASHAGYARMPLHEIFERLLPPIVLQQFFIVRDRADGRALGFISWAKVGEETAAALGENSRKLKLSEWNSGDVGIVMDVAAPNKNAARTLVERVKREMFPQGRLMAMRADAKTKSPLWAEVSIAKTGD